MFVSHSQLPGAAQPWTCTSLSLSVGADCFSRGLHPSSVLWTGMSAAGRHREFSGSPTWAYITDSFPHPQMFPPSSLVLFPIDHLCPRCHHKCQHFNKKDSLGFLMLTGHQLRGWERVLDSFHKLSLGSLCARPLRVTFYPESLCLGFLICQVAVTVAH